MRKVYLLFLIFITIHQFQFSQNTVGLLSYIPEKTQDGYLLLYPQNQGTAFLINNCGEVVHKWIDNSAGPSNSASLMEDGTIWQLKMDNGYTNPYITGGGGGQKIEHRDWDNNLLWRYEYSDSTHRMHHNFVILPNGNVVIIAWERKSYSESIASGRDSSLLPDGEVWPDHLLEIQPISIDSGIIVWEWHAWDHLIQDVNSSLPNYGVVADHPELININYTNGTGFSDWTHFNAIDYNTELDQLIVSCPTFNEIWIIDHSTTTAEAASHSGGLSGKGGDLLFRWGNPAAYNQGDSTDRMLGFQHDIHWMDKELPINHPDRKKLMLFNNRRFPGVSNANIIAPVFDTINWEYQKTGNVYLPTDFEYSYTTPNPSDMFCAVVSSAHRLPNGNTLICTGRKGYTLEVDSLGEIVWEYKTPLLAGNPVTQGTTIPLSGNFTFRTQKYSSDWPGFIGHDLSPLGYIELNPDTNFCRTILSNEIIHTKEISIYPNPANEFLSIKGFDQGAIIDVQISDMMGKVVLSKKYLNLDEIILNVSDLSKGIYFIKTTNFSSRFIKQ